MILIKINDLVIPITVDDTSITVDNDNITSDQTEIMFDGFYKISIIPRYFKETCNLYLRNELTDVEMNFELDMLEDNGICNLVFGEENSIVDKSSFEIVVSENNNLLYRGKGFYTTQTDIQQYTMLERTANNKIII